jgi:CRP-like cAMP-binding protein
MRGSAMSNKSKPTSKATSSKRFEQINMIVDEIVKQLPTPTHGLALIVCWRHANASRQFNLSHNQLAEALRISRRSAIRTMNTLLKVGVIRRVKKGAGATSSRYEITGKVVTPMSPLLKVAPP